MYLRFNRLRGTLRAPYYGEAAVLGQQRVESKNENDM
jgi:hypothetical protein